MRTPLPTKRRVVLIVAATCVLATMIAAPRAQKRDEATWGTPVATNTIMRHPEMYFGKLVTISAGIEQILSNTAFFVDQRKAVSATETKALGQPMLVLFPYVTGTLDQKNYLLMRGEIVKFEASAIARVAGDYTPDLPADVSASYQGKPVLIANLVMDSASTVLGRKPLAPPSALDVSLTAAMTTIRPAAAALRTAVQESKPDIVKLNAALLAPAFMELEAAWDDLGASYAAELSREAHAHSVSIERAAAAGDWETAKASEAALTKVCGSCHGIYRQRQEDGTFRITPGMF